MERPIFLLQKLIHDPLLHFLAAGIALFIVFELFSREPDAFTDSRIIKVNESSLISFIQYRTKVFDPEASLAKLRAASEAELESLIRDYVREEALHRLALEMGLGENDYVIRRRLVQKVEFVASRLGDSVEEPDSAATEAFFRANRDNYVIEPSLTFTHVFYSARDRGKDGAKRLARNKLTELNHDNIAFSEAPQHGDLFPYHTNYVDRSPSYVASHFGESMTQAILSLTPTEATWKGPFTSSFGSHLILLRYNEPGHMPNLEDVSERIVNDIKRADARKIVQAAIDEIVAGYEVQMIYRQRMP